MLRKLLLVVGVSCPWLLSGCEALATLDRVQFQLMEQGKHLNVQSERLEAALESGELNEDAARDLRRAYDDLAKQNAELERGFSDVRDGLSQATEGALTLGEGLAGGGLTTVLAYFLTNYMRNRKYVPDRVPRSPPATPP